MPSLRFGAVSILGVAAVTVSASISACSSNGGSQQFNEDSSASSSGSGTSSNGGTSGSNSSSNAGSSSSSTGSSSSSTGSSGSTSTSSSGNPSSSGSNSSGSGSGGQATFNDAGIPICGNQPCDLRSNTCCVTQFAMGTCIPHGQACASNTAAFSCLTVTDCSGGQVCCGLADANHSTASTSCQTVANSSQCPGTNTQYTAEAQVCETTAECKNNQACLAQTCVIGSGAITITAHLKMCGFQNRPPFNCTLG